MGQDLCEPCINGLSRIEAPFCPRCGEVIDGAITHARRCPNCRNSPKPYDFARAAYRSLGPARELVHRFKYGLQFHLGKPLAKLAFDGFEADQRFRKHDDWLIVPVPLHRTKRRKRGFNQATEIALQFSRLSQLEMREILRRSRPTRTQTKLSRRQRQLNLHKAFSLRRGRRPIEPDRPVLLIDDVFTTGSTVEECARTLGRELRPATIAVLTPLRA